MEEKMLLGLSKEDLLQIHHLYYGTNPIYKSYVYIVMHMLKEMRHGGNMKTEDEFSEVVFYYIMKTIDKVLDMPLKTLEEKEQVKLLFENVLIQLRCLCDQIWIHSEEENTDYVKEYRILAVCHTLHLCLGYIRRYDGINAVLYENYNFNLNFQKNHHADIAWYSNTLHYQIKAGYTFGFIIPISILKMGKRLP